MPCFRNLPLCLSLLLLSACATTPTFSNYAVQLDPGQHTRLTSALTLRFDGVEDSRCPQDVMCVWAGQLVYKLSLVGNGTEPFTLSDKAPAFASASGLHIALAKQQAPPLPRLHQPPPPYTVMLLINSNK